MKRFYSRSLGAISYTLLLLGLSACVAGGGRPTADPFAGGSGGSRPASSSGPESRTVKVHVRNANFMDATLYVTEPGRRRVGRIPGNETRTFDVSSVGFTQVRFRAELLGGKTCTTWYVRADAGGDVDVLIDSVERPRQPNGQMSLCVAQTRRRR
ncbi:MAG: hypothetical protein ACKVG4_01020 [Longimicrobiales bacterium]|jgi:hypothetical protein